MEQAFIIGGIVITAYILQIVFGMKQLKNFNQVYSELRKKGRVAIGRRAGKVQSGTIVMFAVDRRGHVLDARKMRGVTVLARFKPMPTYVGKDIHYFDNYNPMIRKENKLLRIAIEDAREVFLRTEAGNYKDVPKAVPLFNLGAQLSHIPARIKMFFSK